MKKRIFIVGGIVIVAGALGAVGWRYYQEHSAKEVDGNVVYVTAVKSLTEDAAGTQNRFAGVVEPQETVEVNIDSGRKVREVRVKAGEEVKKGQLLFEYDLSSIQDDLREAQLELDRMKNEALSLKDQIATLEAEKRKASADSQLSYTIEIETNKMNLKKNEYDQKSKQAEIDKLNSATGNTEVRSEIDGVIQKIDTTKMSSEDGDLVDEGMSDYYMMDSGNGEDGAFITILSTGAYRIKGKVNEQNMASVIEGEPVIIRSRVDEKQIWRGTMGNIDEQNASTESNNNMYWGMMDSSGDSQTSSSSYPFYVELESSEGLMLGQHVYIEKDEGQEDKKAGLWLNDFYIVDADTDSPYVWAADEKDKLEKRELILGQYDEILGEYEIVEGITVDDYIAFPTENLEEGMPTADGSIQTSGMTGPMDGGTDMETGDMPDMMDEPMDDFGDEFDGEMAPFDEMDEGDYEEYSDYEDMEDYGEDDMAYEDDFMDGEVMTEDEIDMDAFSQIGTIGGLG